MVAADRKNAGVVRDVWVDRSEVVIRYLEVEISGGKRVFKMAPLHHHFELIGWAQITVVIRFWIIAGLCVAMGLGLFYAQWVVK